MITIPKEAQPRSSTASASSRGQSHPVAARAFVKKVLSKKGQAKLRAFGFLPRK